MNLFCRVVIGLLAFCSPYSVSIAAEVTKVEDRSTEYKCNVLVSGEIERGDAEKLASAVQNWPSMVCFDSTGGSFDEALKMAEVLYQKAVGTRILADQRCLSACAIAFMAGTYDTESYIGYLPWRFMHPRSTLGFHSPSLQVPEGQYNKRTVDASYGAALAAIGKLQNLRHRFAISPDLIGEMLKHSGEDFFFIDNIDKAGRFEIGLTDYQIPRGLQDDYHSCMNIFWWDFGQLVDDIAQGRANYDNYFKQFSESRGNRKGFPVEIVHVSAVRSNCRIERDQIDRVDDAGYKYGRDLTYELGVEYDGSQDSTGEQKDIGPVWSRLPYYIKLRDLPKGNLADFKYEWIEKGYKRP
jgi:hypothetical protein